MNSRFKFRAWRKEEKEMLMPADQMHAGDVFKWEHEGQSLVIMQSTGLHAPDKTEIYEGDIVYIAGIGNSLVEFESGNFSFNKEFYFDVIEDLERVVGNIHQNPGIELAT